MSNKPDWKDAPEWANHLAMDSDSEWFWYELEPEIDLALGMFKMKGGKVEPIIYDFNSWPESLESRP